MTRGNRARALATLERIAHENGKPMPLGKLTEPSAKVRLDACMRIVTANTYMICVYTKADIYGI